LPYFPHSLVVPMSPPPPPPTPPPTHAASTFPLSISTLWNTQLFPALVSLPRTRWHPCLHPPGPPPPFLCPCPARPFLFITCHPACFSVLLVARQALFTYRGVLASPAFFSLVCAYSISLFFHRGTPFIPPIPFPSLSTSLPESSDRFLFRLGCITCSPCGCPVFASPAFQGMLPPPSDFFSLSPCWRFGASFFLFFFIFPTPIEQFTPFPPPPPFLLDHTPTPSLVFLVSLSTYFFFFFLHHLPPYFPRYHFCAFPPPLSSVPPVC